MFNSRFKSLSDLRKAFPTEQSCIDYLEERRWHGNIVSPFDKTSKVYKCKNNRYRCKNTMKYFDVKTKTIFQGTRISLISWFEAIWMILSYKKGISSVQLGKNINVSQKTAWFMMHRIRETLEIDNINDNDSSNIWAFTNNFMERIKTINEYQQAALSTAIYPEKFKIVYPVLGLTGEAGEVSDKIKKVLRDNNGEFSEEKRIEIAKEIGDVAWYMATLSNDLGYTLEEIFNMNIQKLQSRKERNVLNGSGDNR